MTDRAQKLIDTLGLEPHIEGGYFKRNYVSDTIIDYGTHKGRPIMSSIYYLLSGNDFSAFHRMDCDEMWNYYEGTTDLIIHRLTPNNQYIKVALGPDVHCFQYCVPAGDWLAVELSAKGATHYALSGCVVAPRFLEDTHEMGSAYNLQQHYPKHHELINQLTRS